MKLAAWARANCVHPQTACRWFRQGTILVQVRGSDDDGLAQRAVLYARVSTHDQRGELDRQVTRLSRWATTQGVTVAEVVTEVGSGLNGRRPKLRRVLADPRAAMIVVEHRDRLARFGVEHLEAALSAQGRRLVMIDPGEASDDLVGDMVEVLTSFCACLYGRRGARNRALRAVTCVKQPPGRAVPSDPDTGGEQR